MNATVQEFMTHDVLACEPGDSLGLAAMRMWDADCGMLPVVGGGKVLGVITDRDICMALALHGARPGERLVAEVASGSVHGCTPQDDVTVALASMARHQVRRLVVLEDGRLAGVLSINDVIACAGENETLRQPILAALERICAHRSLPAPPALAAG
jgi:CBS domain-containing protein